MSGAAPSPAPAPSGDSTLRIGLVLPEVLGTYGDSGNAVVLRERLRRRGHAAEIVATGFGEPVPEFLDLYTLGGGEGSAQRLAARHLSAHPGLHRAVERRTPVLAVCAGFQVLSTRLTTADGTAIDGLGLLDATTVAGTGRAIGEVAAAPLTEGLSAPLSGFANHAGRTTLGPDAAPLARVTSGPGNAGGESDGESDGAVQGPILATYLHGPVLARNPELADLLIARALGIAPSELAPLSMPEVDALRSERLAAR